MELLLTFRKNWKISYNCIEIFIPFFWNFNEYLLKFFSNKYPLKLNLSFVEISTNNHWKFKIGLKKRMKKSMAYHWKIISLIIHLKFNKYLLKYYYWHLSDIWLSLQGINYISLKFQRSFQTVCILINSELNFGKPS